MRAHSRPRLEVTGIASDGVFSEPHGVNDRDRDHVLEPGNERPGPGPLVGTGKRTTGTGATSVGLRLVALVIASGTGARGGSQHV